MITRYATSTFHSLEYYKRLLLCIAKCLTRGAKHRHIVEELNREGIHSPVGTPFNIEALKRILKSLRNPTDYPSKTQHAMLQLYFDGGLTKAECIPLTHLRAGTM